MDLPADMSETNSLKIMVTGAGKEIPLPLLNEDIQYENRRNLKMKKVVKFGGSSLASAEQFRKVGEIIHAEKERRYVVPSAPGKRYSGDTKVTDMLYDCYNSASANGDISGKIKAIQARYQEIIDLDWNSHLMSSLQRSRKNLRRVSAAITRHPAVNF